MGNELIKTGNPAVDMVYAAVQHYKRFGRKVKTVSLDRSYWNLFDAFMNEQENADKVDITPDGIQFNDLLVRRGTQFQKDRIEIELYPQIEKTLVNEG